ncbi:MAG: hypothetical protein Q4C25_03125 [Bacillota bacterium]|nr:hypothetical protein [Bacillota bacterium]
MFFKNHFGMVVTMIIALILSLCMATTAICIGGLPLNICMIARSWGTCFLVIMLVSIIIPSKIWGDKLAMKCKLKPNTLKFGLVSNIIPTFVYNTAATFALPAVNIFYNDAIPEAAQLPAYLSSVKHDYLIMFVLSYFVSLIAEKIALQVAFKNVPPITKEM